MSVDIGREAYEVYNVLNDSAKQIRDINNKEAYLDSDSCETLGKTLSSMSSKVNTLSNKVKENEKDIDNSNYINTLDFYLIFFQQSSMIVNMQRVRKYMCSAVKEDNYHDFVDLYLENVSLRLDFSRQLILSPILKANK